MKATELQIGMTVKSLSGVVVEVTDIQEFKKTNECFFSGKVVSAPDGHYYSGSEGVNFKHNWNSHFFFPE